MTKLRPGLDIGTSRAVPQDCGPPRGHLGVPRELEAGAGAQRRRDIVGLIIH
jgi:hypothetical protein